MGSVGSNNREKSITVNAEGSNVSSRSEVTSNSSLDLSNRTSEQLDALYESAAASRDRELMQAILTELARRPQEESQQSYAYTSRNTRRRGTRGRR